MAGEGGFALDEYVVPKHGHPAKILGGTVPKGDSAKSSHMSQVIAKAGKTPGPDCYYKDIHNKSFTLQAAGGTFCKLPRDARLKLHSVPSVGQYTVDKDVVSPRIPGGPMSKSPRSNYLFDQAAFRSRQQQAPGKYDAKELEAHTQGPSFNNPQTTSRVPVKAMNPPGPGHYNPEYDIQERRPPCYSSRKETTKSFVDTIEKAKAKLPAPGHCGIPFSKFEDAVGRKKHTDNLLKDRSNPASPRI